MPRNGGNNGSIVITYNKDLAYLAGKIKIVRFLEVATEEDLNMVFKAKYDPTNHRQRHIVESVLQS